MSTTRATSGIALPSGPHEFGKHHPDPRPRTVRQVVDVVLPTPKMGGKAWLLSEKGIFILERGPGTLRTIACTHAGAGNIEAIDGVPNDDGFFPDEELPRPVRLLGESDEMFAARQREYHGKNGTRNGRAFYRGNPIMMGSWMLDAGFMHGLTLRVEGGHDSTSAIATVVWMPFRQRAA